MLVSSANSQYETEICQQCKEEEGIVARIIDLIEESKSCLRSKEKLNQIAIFVQSAIISGLFALSTI